MSVLNLIRSDLKLMQNEIPKSRELGCRLHANELPWAPLSLEGVPLNYYPHGTEQLLLEKQLANCYQVKPEQLTLTRGSDDGIDLLMRLFLSAGQDSCLQCPPTFAMYAFYARLQQIELINCPLDAGNNFSLSADQLISLWQPNCKLIMLCRPNNPTGNLVDLTTIAQLCDYFTNKAIVIVDEAYIEFAQVASATTLLPSFDNLVVLRTLSKAYGLAGLRLGCLIAQEQLIEAIQRIMPPYLLSSAVINLAQRALIKKTWFANKRDCIVNAREQLIANLQQSPWIQKVYPSAANFVLLTSPYAAQLAAWFAEHDIAVRSFSAVDLQDKLRITVGTPAQNQRLLSALTDFSGDF